MNPLQRSLLINAIFSAISGILLIAFHKQIAHVFDIPNTTVFWIIGAALIFFSATIIYEIKRQRPIGVLIIIVQDFLWVFGSILLLIFYSSAISTSGNIIIASIALIVLLMGMNQAKAPAQIGNKVNKGMKQLSFERTVNANREQVWKVISDVANYHRFAPNIDDVKIISGEGLGMTRRCSHGKDNWIESCTLWEEGKEFAFEVNTTAPDYPYPFKYLKGSWKVEEMGNTQTKIIMLFDFRYKRQYQNWLLHPILQGKLSKIASELLDNWEKQVEKK